MNRHIVLFVVLLVAVVPRQAVSSEMDFWDKVSQASWNVSCGSAGSGNAWAASASCNPALLWGEEEFGASTQYYGKSLGPAWLHSHSESITLPVASGEYGAFQLSYYGAVSGSARSHDPEVGTFAIRSIGATSFYYGTSLKKGVFQESDTLSGGLGYTYYTLDAEVNRKSPDGYREKDTGHAATIGLAYETEEEFGIGVTYTVLPERFDTKLQTGEKIKANGVEHQLRAGVKIPVVKEPKRLDLTLDYQYLDTGIKKHHQVFGGVTYQASEHVSLSAGWAGSGPTVGVGYASGPVAVEAAVGYSVSSSKWDHGKTATLSVSISF